MAGIRHCFSVCLQIMIESFRALRSFQCNRTAYLKISSPVSLLIKAGFHRGILVTGVSLLSLCTHPLLQVPPSGDGWKTCNQGYTSYMMTQTTSENAYYKVTTTSYESHNKVFEGSPMYSHEITTCKDRAFLCDCKEFDSLYVQKARDNAAK
jgi:hypothetical protein